jgi:hypothetical protein
VPRLSLKGKNVQCPSAIGCLRRNHGKKTICINRISCQEEIDLLIEYGPELLESQGPEFLENARERLKPADRFRKNNGKLKNSWKDVSIARMAEETGRSIAYRSLYRWGSGMVHGDITSIAASFDLEAGHVDVGPSTKWTHTAVRTAHHAMLCLMMDFNQTAGLGFDAEVQKAEETFKQAWAPENSK